MRSHVQDNATVYAEILVMSMWFLKEHYIIEITGGLIAIITTEGRFKFMAHTHKVVSWSQCTNINLE